MIGGRATAQRSARTTRGSGRGGTVDAGARGGGGAESGPDNKAPGSGAGGERGGCAGRGLEVYNCVSYCIAETGELNVILDDRDGCSLARTDGWDSFCGRSAIE